MTRLPAAKPVMGARQLLTQAIAKPAQHYIPALGNAVKCVQLRDTIEGVDPSARGFS